MFTGVGVSCQISYSFVSYRNLFVSLRGLITSVGEDWLVLLLFITDKRYTLPVGASDMLHYFIVAHTVPSI